MCAPAGVRCVYEAESDTECEVMNSRGGGHGACRSCSVLCVRVCTSWPRCVAARGRRGAGAWARPVSGVGVGSAPGRAVPQSYALRQNSINAQNTIASMRESSRAHENPASSQRTSVRHRRSDHVGWPFEHVHR